MVEPEDVGEAAVIGWQILPRSLTVVFSVHDGVYVRPRATLSPRLITARYRREFGRERRAVSDRVLGAWARLAGDNDAML